MNPMNQINQINSQPLPQQDLLQKPQLRDSEREVIFITAKQFSFRVFDLWKIDVCLYNENLLLRDQQEFLAECEICLDGVYGKRVCVIEEGISGEGKDKPIGTLKIQLEFMADEVSRDAFTNGKFFFGLIGGRAGSHFV
jgi:hypothetical protein